MKFTQKVILCLILIIPVNSPVIQSVSGCSFAGEVNNFVTIYDLDNHEKIAEKELNYLGVGGDCQIQNTIVPSNSGQIYIQDESDKIDLVNISNGKWSVTDQFSYKNIYRPLSIYQTTVIENPNIEGLKDKSKFQLNMYDFNSSKEVILKIDLNDELKHSYQNNSVIRDQWLVTSNNNWLSFFAQIGNKTWNETNNDPVYYWIYKYNLMNGENNTYTGNLSRNYDIGDRDSGQFQISNDGNNAFVIENFPYQNLISFDLLSNETKELSSEIPITYKWIVNDSVYYLNSQNSDYSINYFNLTSGVSEQITEFQDIYPNKIVVSEKYIIIADTRAEDGFLNGNVYFIPIVASILVLTVLKRSRKFDEI